MRSTASDDGNRYSDCNPGFILPVVMIGSRGWRGSGPTENADGASGRDTCVCEHPHRGSPRVIVDGRSAGT